MNTFIIGAGFTKAVFPEAPLNRDLLGALAEKSTDSAAAILWDTYKTDDIEIALTRLDADIAVSQGERGSLAEDGYKLRRRIETELGNYFSSFLASEELLERSQWLARFIDGVFIPGDVVISLNYDCVLEGALDYLLKARGSPAFPLPTMCALQPRWTLCWRTSRLLAPKS